ncbi:ribosomal protein S8 [Xylaria sp. FL1042]|nr:ribosomal protein S8 [Xylaria sp. FL1042]
MGIQSIVSMASHLQNASRARLGLTSVPHNKLNLGMALALHRAGFISFVTRGGPHPPDPATLSTYEPEPLTNANVSRQRLWLGLKYTNNAPVLAKMQPVSTPKRHVSTSLPGLDRLARGFSASRVRGLNLGECMFVQTSLGTLEVREAIQRKVGGILLCRAGP